MAYKLNRENWDLNFAFATFEKLDLPSLVQIGALPSYNGSQVEEMNVYIPNILEQQKIGLVLYELDSLITLHQ